MEPLATSGVMVLSMLSTPPSLDTPRVIVLVLVVIAFAFAAFIQ